MGLRNGLPEAENQPPCYSIMSLDTALTSGTRSCASKFVNMFLFLDIAVYVLKKDRPGVEIEACRLAAALGDHIGEFLGNLDP